MSYKLEDFKNKGVYEEKTGGKECQLDGGQVIRNLYVPDRTKELMRTVGGSSHGGDRSRQDSAVITSLLSAGYKPADVYATFSASARGKDAKERKNSHFEDYARRTIEKAAGFLGKSEGNVSVDFANKRAVSGTGLVISMGNEVETEKIRWIWPGYLPAGKLTLIAGDPGMGKSTIVSDLVSRISKGTSLPAGNRTVTGTSLIASAEDSPEDTIVPRLIASEANLKKVGIIREVREKNEIEEDESRFLSFPRDLKILREALVAKGCRILVIDPLNAFIEKGTDTYKDQDMRRVLHPLEAIAEETGTAILVVAHLTKNEDTSTLYRVGGSIGFIGAARSVLAVARMADESRVLYSLKSNLSSRPPSLSYEIKQVRKQRKDKEWLGEEIIHSSSIRWLGEVDFNPFSKSPASSTEGKIIEEATEFLTQVLEDAGELDTDILYREAKLAGIARPNLNKAKTALGVKAIKKHGTWYWQWASR